MGACSEKTQEGAGSSRGRSDTSLVEQDAASRYSGIVANMNSAELERFRCSQD